MIADPALGMTVVAQLPSRAGVSGLFGTGGEVGDLRTRRGLTDTTEAVVTSWQLRRRGDLAVRRIGTAGERLSRGGGPGPADGRCRGRASVRLGRRAASGRPGCLRLRHRPHRRRWLRRRSRRAGHRRRTTALSTGADRSLARARCRIHRLAGGATRLRTHHHRRWSPATIWSYQLDVAEPGAVMLRHVTDCVTRGAPTGGRGSRRPDLRQSGPAGFRAVSDVWARGHRHLGARSLCSGARRSDRRRERPRRVVGDRALSAGQGMVDGPFGYSGTTLRA